jgi:hypothetical protein
MRVFALGLALLGLPVAASASSSSEPPAPPASTQRPEFTVTVHLPLDSAPRSQHRDDESGAVIREIRIGPKGVAPNSVVHCHGHAFQAIVTVKPGGEAVEPAAAGADYLTKR